MFVRWEGKEGETAVTVVRYRLRCPECCVSGYPKGEVSTPAPFPPTPSVCEATIASLKICYRVRALSLHGEKKKNFYSKWGNALKPQLWSKAEGFSDNLFVSVQPGPTAVWLFMATGSCPAISSGRIQAAILHLHQEDGPMAVVTWGEVSR